MEEIKELFTPFIGQLVWQVRRGHGSFLTMEFGVSHLIVREPITPRPDASEKVKRNLLRRHVEVTGDWHLWIQYGNWRLSNSNDVLTSIESPGSQLDECLRDLEGQRFVSVGHGARDGSSEFTFDLGARLEIWPSIEISDDQWSCTVGLAIS